MVLATAREEDRKKTIVESQQLGLPLPRLQLTWCPSKEEDTCLCFYDLLLPVGKLDIRNLGESGCTLAEISVTKTNHSIKDKGTTTPYRDGSHIAWDAYRLKLPAYVVNGRTYQQIDPKEPPHG